MDKDHILRLDVMGQFLGAILLEDAISKYNLTKEQIDHLNSTGQLELKEGLIVLTAF